MGRDENENLGRFLSLILRHKPEVIGIRLDEHGWADINELIEGMNRAGKHIDRAKLDEIVATNNKKRYSISEDGKKIRAKQGHSVQVDVELKEQKPPEVLYHGTAERFRESIEREGLKPMGRLYVHLSKDTATAETVGSRHGKPIIYEVAAGEMSENGFKFYLSENMVWLTERVPPIYLRRWREKI